MAEDDGILVEGSLGGSCQDDALGGLPPEHDPVRPGGPMLGDMHLDERAQRRAYSALCFGDVSKSRMSQPGPDYFG